MEPSREGVLAAFTDLYNQAVVAAAVSAQGITTVATTTDRDTFYADADNQSKLVYVNNNNGAADDPDNGVYEYVDGAPRIAEGFYQGVAVIVQPLVAAAQTAQAGAEMAEAGAQALHNSNVALAGSKSDANTYDLSSVYRLAGQTAGTGQYDVIVGLLAGTDISADKPFEAFSMFMSLGAGCTSVPITITLRPSGNDITLAPGSAGDIVVGSVTLTPAALGLTPGGGFGQVYIDGFGSIVPADGDIIFVEIDPQTASGRASIGYQLNLTNSAAAYRGWKRAGAASVLAQIDANYSFAIDLFAKTRLPTEATIARQAAEASKPNAAVRWKCVADRAGWSPAFNLMQPATGTFAGWVTPFVVGRDVAANIPVRRFQMEAQQDALTSAESTAGRVILNRVRVYYRPPGASQTAIPFQQTDVLLATKYVVPDNNALTSAPELASLIDAVLDSPIHTGPAGGMILIEVRPFTDGGVPKRLAAYTSSDYVTDVTVNGWYLGNTNVATAYVPLGASGNGNTIGARLFAEERADEPLTGDRVIACEASVSGYTVTLDATRSAIALLGVPQAMAGAVTLDAPTTGVVPTSAPETITLTYPASSAGNGPGFANTPNGILAHGNVSALTVKNGSTVLTQGVAGGFDVASQIGALMLHSAGSDITATVAYTWSAERCDLICWDRSTGALAVVKGTEGVRDAAERIPVPASVDQIPLFHAFVRASRVTLQPVWKASQGVGQWLDSVPMIRRDALRHARVNGRSLTKLRQGQTLKIGFYGTSIFNIGPGGSATAPNGTNRDVPAFFTALTSGGGIGADLINALPLFDHGDGGGQIHTHVGAHWTMAAVLNAMFGTNIGIAGSDSTPTNSTLENMAISGSYTGTQANGANNATRLNALTASDVDLVVIDMTANENISSAATIATTRANIIAIIAACRAVGKDVMVLGSWMRNPLLKTGQHNAFRKLNSAMRQAAEYDGGTYPGASFVDLGWLYGEEGRHLLGVDPHHWGQANIAQHPGFRELDRAGRLIAFVACGA